MPRVTLHVRTREARFPLDDDDLREFREKFDGKLEIEQRPLYLAYVGVSDVVYVVLRIAETLATGVAAHLISTLLWEKLKNRAAVVTVFDPEKPTVPAAPIQSGRDLEREILRASRSGSEVFAYNGYYYCRRCAAPVWSFQGALWCPNERRYLRP